MTKKIMEREGIVFTEVDLRKHPDQLASFQAQGLTQAPIVTTDTKIWSGFRLDKIVSLAKFIRSAERA
jgi:glutaredoxin